MIILKTREDLEQIATEAMSKKAVLITGTTIVMIINNINIIGTIAETLKTLNIIETIKMLIKRREIIDTTIVTIVITIETVTETMQEILATGGIAAIEKMTIEMKILNEGEVCFVFLSINCIINANDCNVEIVKALLVGKGCLLDIFFKCFIDVKTSNFLTFIENLLKLAE